MFSALTLLVGRQEGIWPVKKMEWWGAGMVICLERVADLHTAQLIPLPLTVSCFSKILVPSHPGSPGKRATKRVCVCVCVQTIIMLTVTRIPCYSYQYKLHCAIVTNYMFLYETNSFCVICADTGRGLMALKYLKPGDVIISLPESLLVTSCSVLTSSAIGPALRRFVTRTAVSYRIVYSLNNNDLFNGLVSWYQKNIIVLF